MNENYSNASRIVHDAGMPSRRVDARSSDGPDGSRSETNETRRMRTPATLRRERVGVFLL